MPAYLLFIREEPIQDLAEMEEYRRKLRANPPESSKLNPLILNGATELLEGDATPSSVVMFEFPTSEDAKIGTIPPLTKMRFPIVSHRERCVS